VWSKRLAGSHNRTGSFFTKKAISDIRQQEEIVSSIPFCQGNHRDRILADFPCQTVTLEPTVVPVEDPDTAMLDPRQAARDILTHFLASFFSR